MGDQADNPWICANLHVLDMCLRGERQRGVGSFFFTLPSPPQVLWLAGWVTWRVGEIVKAEVHKLVAACPTKSCEADPLPSWLLKDRLVEFVPWLTDIINKLLAESTVHASFIIRPLLKGPGG